MSERTAIEWTDHTWSPWIGCTPVSMACDHCYAAALARHWNGPKYEAGAPRRRTSADYWTKLATWNRKAERAGRRATVFPSLCDPFDTEVDPAWRVDHFQAIAATPWLIHLLLTKRPQVARKWAEAHPLPDNVWLGVTVETQVMADLRIPILLGIEARVRFLSCEPLLGPVDLSEWICGSCDSTGWVDDMNWEPTIPGVPALRTRGDGLIRCAACNLGGGREKLGKINQVIDGGESGPRARPTHPDWFRLIRDVCVPAGVAYFHKQNGDWVSVSEVEGAGRHHSFDDGATVRRVGKKAAGATLDGREWREVPR